MAPLSLRLSPLQLHALLLVSYIILGVLSAALLFLIARAAFTWIPGILSRRNLEHNRVSADANDDSRDTIITVSISPLPCSHTYCVSCM
jgi:hypothetical protein